MIRPIATPAASPSSRRNSVDPVTMDDGVGDTNASNPTYSAVSLLRSA